MGAFDDWIGRGSRREDTISPRLIAQFRATLPDLAGEEEVPLGLFWTLSPDAYPPADLGRDGHPRLGLELPPLPLKRRMWAGGEIAFHGVFHEGDAVVRKSRIERIAEKIGSTGPLIFVSVRHEYSVAGGLVLSERQDLVYREDPEAGAPAPHYPDAPELGPAVASMPLVSDPVRLFRFSAMTFNGHRIHYDADYARGVEGYAGLVVHGPLQAVAMMTLAARVLCRCPARFTYRGMSPLVVGQDAVVEAHRLDGALSLRVRRSGGPVTMAGTAV